MRSIPGQRTALSPPSLTPVAALVRRHDPDRFFTAILAPPDRRDTLLLLYAFNHELARAREVASQPTLALIRLQWWREVVEGARRRHEVAGPLGEAIDAGVLPQSDLAAMIDGREKEAGEGFAAFGDFQAFVRGTAGTVAGAAARALGAGPDETARIAALGTAYGVAGQVRSVAPLARQGRCLLPHDLLGAQGLTPEQVVARPGDPRLLPVIETLAVWGRTLLAEHGGPVPRQVLAAALPAVLARRDLRAPPRVPAPRGIADRLAVLAAAARGTV